MKAFKNRLEEMAEATVNALDYSDSKVEYPDISMVQKWPKEIILPLYDLYKNTRYSELVSILMYTQHQARFEEIGELMLGIGLVEMVHYDKLGDFLLKASDVMDTEIPVNCTSNNRSWYFSRICFKIIITSRKRNFRRIL